MHKNELPTGTIIDSNNYSYKIIETLGRGGFGITYLAEGWILTGSIRHKVKFALKEHFLSDVCERDHETLKVRNSKASQGKVNDSLADFIAEATRLSQLDHPNIVCVNEVFKSNDTAYYVMEFVEGENMRSYINRNGVVNEQQLLEIISPLLHATQYMHDNNMTHLDIKPDNVMLKVDDETGQYIPMLIDFGLAKHYDSDGHPTSTIRLQGCSDGYAPMEQYAGIRTFTPQADIYALGALMMYMLTGRDPIVASDQSTDKILAALPAEISENTRNAIVHAMQTLRGSRTSSVKELASELGIMLKTGDITPIPDRTCGIIMPHEETRDDKRDNGPVVVKKKKQPSSWSMPLLFVAIFLLAGAVTWFFINGSKHNGETTDTSSVVVEKPTTEPEPVIPPTPQPPRPESPHTQEPDFQPSHNNAEAEIREFVELMQLQIGMDFNGVVVSNIYYDGKSLVFVCDMSNIAFSDIGMTKGEFISTTKENMFTMGIPSFNEDDSKFYRLLIDNGKGLTYKYKFNDGVTIVIKFSNSELNRLIKF